MSRCRLIFAAIFVMLVVVPLSWLVCEAALTVREFRGVVCQVPEVVDSAIRDSALVATMETSEKLSQVVREVGRLRAGIDGSLSRVVDVVDNRTALVHADALTQTTLIRAEIRGELSRMSGAIEGLESAARPTLFSFGKLADTYEALPGRFEYAMRPYWECRGNPSCWPSQWTAIQGGAKVLIGEAAQSMRTFDSRFPSMMDSMDDIARNVSRGTNWYVSKKRIALDTGIRIGVMLRPW